MTTTSNKNYFCYILGNDDNMKTYNGFTVDINRRIRQHNGQLKGGAKATKGVSTWSVLAYITGFPNNINALQCEWRIKYPENKKRNKSLTGPEGRIKGLNMVLGLDKWTGNSTIDNKDMVLTVYVDEKYINIITVNKPNIIIKKIEK